jgi:surfactin synthase thioesterase subunit
VCISAAKTAGAELAHALLERSQGSRPVTLVGSSFGALVIFEALKHMKERKHNGGIIMYGPHIVSAFVFPLGVIPDHTSSVHVRDGCTQLCSPRPSRRMGEKTTVV